MWQAGPLIFNGLHGVISQKIELFIVAAVRTSDLTTYMTFEVLTAVSVDFGFSGM
jgi:hypothetical protein